jgi:hypothetical protein
MDKGEEQMKKYTVQYAVSAFPYITVEAENEQEAEEKAYLIPWSKWTLDIDYSTAEEAVITEA